MHELGLAFDLHVNDESQLTDLGTVWEQMGGVWGGHFKDPIHFEAGGDLSDYAAQAMQSPATQSYSEKAVDLVYPLVAPAVGAMEVAGQLLPDSQNYYLNDLKKSLSSPAYALEQSWADVVRLWNAL